jgi:membrane-associated phospholipid phosphatase
MKYKCHRPTNSPTIGLHLNETRYNGANVSVFGLSSSNFLACKSAKIEFGIFEESMEDKSVFKDPNPIVSQSELGAIFKPTTRGEYFAYWISNLGSPPVLVMLTLLLIALTASSPSIWLWNAAYLIAIIIPMLYLFRLLRQNKITDMDVFVREQRARPLLVTIASLGTVLTILILGRAPRAMIILTTASLVQAIAIFLITLRWKISMHSATSAAVAVLILNVFGKAAAPVALSVPLIAWSRVKLRRHTFMQTVAGALLGGGIFLTTILLIPI